jgi:predicted peroxiredoxin
VLVQTTAGAEDPTRAVLAFVGAFGAAQAGHDVTLVLAGDAAGLLNDATAESTSDVALGSIKDWFPRIQKYKIPVYV